MIDAELPVIRVSQAIQFCNSLLQELDMWVEGEVASYSVSRGQYVFFDLKDEEQESKLGCFMMLHQQSIPLEDGMRVVVRGRPGIHTKSGRFSLTVRQIEARGEGSVKRAFELLKAKLNQEGLFAPERKRPLPRYPQRVGIISSKEAAGYGDFMRIATERLQGIEYVLINVAVQGKDAEAEICTAFDHLNSHYQLDVIVLVRGGGSMEDLHAFNSEPVARALVRSKAPVIVGVGHERDITIADYCADVRAATPSNAAQLLLPTQQELCSLIAQLTQDGQRQVERRIALQRERLTGAVERMYSQMRFVLQQAEQKVRHTLKTIEAISPEQTLKRGYSITWQADGSILRSAKEATPGAALTTQLADGSIHSVISQP